MKQHKNIKCALTIDCHFLFDSTSIFNLEGIHKICVAEPVAGQAFYILDRSAEEILKEHKDIIWEYPPERPDFCYPDADSILGGHIRKILDCAEADPRKYLVALMHLAALTSKITPVIGIRFSIAKDMLNKYAVRLLTTDRQGTAVTDDLKPGVYYICGVFVMGAKTRIWNVRTDIKPGKNHLTLDNRNIVGNEAAVFENMVNFIEREKVSKFKI